jgi:hypothetical protein
MEGKQCRFDTPVSGLGHWRAVVNTVMNLEEKSTAPQRHCFVEFIGWNHEPEAKVMKLLFILLHRSKDVNLRNMSLER